MLFLIGPHFQSLEIIQLHILSLLQNMFQNGDNFFLNMDPGSTLKCKTLMLEDEIS